MTAKQKAKLFELLENLKGDEDAAARANRIIEVKIWVEQNIQEVSA